MTAYYNEFEPFAADWLENLIADGQIAPGVVDRRSIEDVHPNDLNGFTQVSLFAGIGGWSLAARRAGWRDDWPLWSMSCPCQPFSSAGKGDGFDDERHLWPAANQLVRVHRPPVCVGEQVASKDADAWIDLVQSDLEAVDYAFGCVPAPSAGFGAPHLRDRNYWLAYAESLRWQGQPLRKAGGGSPLGTADNVASDGLAYAEHAERRAVGEYRENGRDGPDDRREETHRQLGARGEVFGMAYADGRNARPERQQRSGEQRLYEGGNGSDGLADSTGDGRGEERSVGRGRIVGNDAQGRTAGFGAGDESGRLVDAIGAGPQGYGGHVAGGDEPGRLDAQPDRSVAATGRGICRVADANARVAEQPSGVGAGSGEAESGRPFDQFAGRRDYGWPDPLNGPWRGADWLFCTDAKWRPVESNSTALAHGLPRGMGTIGAGLGRLANVAGADAASLKRAKAYRIGSLRGYGNAINAYHAEQFMITVREVLGL